MLALKNLQKSYTLGKNEAVKVLNDINIEFRDKEFVSILGPSGCGKTTLLNIIGGLDKATGGDIIVENKKIKDFDAVELDTYRSKRIGFIFQSYNLITNLNILQNVELALTIGGVSQSERKKRAIEALEKVGLKKHIRKNPLQLSGGQMQRVAIARALVNEPTIILADEPTGALDSESGLQVMEILKEISKARLVLMVTHNPDLAKEYSDRIIELKDGCVVKDSNPYDSSKSEVLKSDISNNKLILLRGELKHSLYKARKRVMKSAGLNEYIFSDICRLRDGELPEKYKGNAKAIENLKALSEKKSKQIDKVFEIEQLIQNSANFDIHKINEIKFQYVVRDSLKEELGFNKGEANEKEISKKVLSFLKKIKIKICRENFIGEPEADNLLKLRESDRIGSTKIEPQNRVALNKYRKMLDELSELKLYTDRIDTMTLIELQRLVGKYKTRKFQKKTRLGKWLESQISSDYSSMTRMTAFKLSMNSLRTKKHRTISTAIAGSIGIIGVILVLGISAGMKTYIRRTEEASLAKYPLEIQRESFDFNRMVEMFQQANEDKNLPKWPKKKDILVNKQVSKMISEILGNIDLLNSKGNDLAFATQHLAQHFARNKDDGYLKKEYGVDFSVFAKRGEGDEERYEKVHPYTDVMKKYLGMLPKDYQSRIEANTSTMFQGWTESPGVELLKTQYELVDGKWPTDIGDTTLVTDEKNQIPDYVLAQLGLIDGTDLIQKDVSKLMSKLNRSEIMGKEYEIVPRYKYFEEKAGQFEERDEGYFHPEEKADYARTKENVLKNSEKVKMKITGVIRPKKNTEATLLSSNILYSNKLIPYLIKKGLDQEVVKRQMNALTSYSDNEFQLKAKFTNNTLSKIGFTPEEIEKGNIGYNTNVKNVGNDKMYERVLRQLGVADLNNPKNLKAYFTSYAAKERFKEELKKMANMPLREHIRNSETKFIDGFGGEVKDKAKIVYIDFLELIMKYIRRMANIVTYVLVGFSSISLIVSTIMISIIVYTSVLERKKEIGILRSLGARKKDISRLFSSESFMLGSISGLMGIAGSLTVWGILEAVIRFKFKLIQQGGLISIKWYHCVIMLAVSIVLSILAGLLPSALAAKQDPAITLRTQ